MIIMHFAKSSVDRSIELTADVRLQFFIEKQIPHGEVTPTGAHHYRVVQHANANRYATLTSQLPERHDHQRV